MKHSLKRIFALLLFLTAAIGTVRAQSPQAVMENYLERIRETRNLPAIASAVIVEGKILSIAAVGTRKAGETIPVTVEDKFHLGSDTKAMTATLIALLVKEGKLQWETTLGDVFPEVFADKATKPAWRNVTLLQLLSHRSGLSGASWSPDKTFAQMHKLPGKPREQRTAYVKQMLRLEPAYPTGSKSLYCNAGYALAGAMAETIMNTPYEELMQARLFAPLGIRSAGFGAMGTPGKTDQPWQHRRENGKTIPVEPSPTSDNPPVIAPAGTVHMTMGDWAKFVLAHLGSDAKDALLTPAMLKTLQTAQFGDQYTLGWAVMERPWGGGRVFTHAGSNNQNFAVVWMAPKKKFAVLVATNIGGEDAAQACDEAAAAAIGTFLVKNN
jgi:CubicO group peptidase (beta-lactamase class C family)